MRMVPALAVLGACSPPVVMRAPTPAVQLEPANFDRVVVSPTVGSVPLAVEVRALNTHQSPIASVTRSVDVDGESIDVSFDGWGYGTLVFETPGTYEVSNGIEVVKVHALDTTWSGLGMDPATTSPVPGTEMTMVEPVRSGFLVASKTGVFHVSPTAGAHQILATNDIEGLATGNLDTDGVLDAVIWTPSTVYAFQGRPEGGMAFRASWEASGYLAAGAEIGDVSGDSLPDLVIAWAGSDNNNWIDVWESDGLWNLTAVPPRLMQTIPTDIALGDNTGEGALQITATNAEASWERFIEGADTKYIPIGPRLEILTPAEATVRSGWDMNGDDGDELFFLGPRFDNAPREILIFDFVGTNPEFLKISSPGAYVQITDTNADGLGDLLQLQNNGLLQSLSFQGGVYSTRQAITLRDPAAFGLNDLDRGEDNLPELLVAGDTRWSWFRGGTNTNESEAWYSPALPVLVDPDLRIEGKTVQSEIDGNEETTDLVGFEILTGRTYLKVWTLESSDGSVTDYRELRISESGQLPLDLAVCDGIAWVLLDGTAHRIDLNGQEPLETGNTNTTATALDCGQGAFGSDAVLLETSTLVYLDNALNVVGNEGAAGAVNLAHSAGEVLTCDEEDCSIEAWNGVWVVSGSTVFVTDGEDSTPLTGSGHLVVADIDDNGHDDVLIMDEHDLWLYRSTGSGLGPAEGFHTEETLLGQAFVADLTNDGENNLLFALEDNTLRYTVAPQAWEPSSGAPGGDEGPEE